MEEQKAEQAGVTLSLTVEPATQTVAMHMSEGVALPADEAAAAVGAAAEEAAGDSNNVEMAQADPAPAAAPQDFAVEEAPSVAEGGAEANGTLLQHGADAAANGSADAVEAVEEEATAEEEEEEGGAAAGVGAQQSANVQALHEEILRFAEEAAPTEDEAARKEAALSAIQAACRTALSNNRRMKVQLFGSGAHGIGLRHSDLDVVITHFITPLGASGNFTTEQKENVGHSLRRISDALMRDKVATRRPLVIYNARVPVAKVDMSNGVRADISIGTEDGPKAAAYLVEQQARFAMLRPLCMVVKALLMDAGLHEVGRGGVSTWTAANMALALLMEQEKAGCGTDCAGHLLLGFLKYYGRVFDYAAQAVAVGRGGIVPKADVPVAAKTAAQQGGGGGAGRLCVEDPITGRDVAGGSHRVAEVTRMLADAASKLELLLKAPAPPPGGFLPLLFNVQAILEGRSGAGQQAVPQQQVQGGGPGPSPGGGLKRGRDRDRDREPTGPRKGGPGPRPMHKSAQTGSSIQTVVRPYSVPAGLRAGHAGAGGGMLGGAQQLAQQGQLVMGGGGGMAMPAGAVVVQQGVPGMHGVQVVLAGGGQLGAQPQQLYLQPQQAQYAAAPGGGLVVLGGGVPQQAQQLMVGPAGYTTAVPQQAQQLVLMPGGMALPPGAQVVMQQPAAGLGQGVQGGQQVYFAQGAGGYMQQ